MEKLLRELGVPKHLETQKRRDTEKEEKKRMPRRMPCLGARAPLTGGSFADML